MNIDKAVVEAAQKWADLLQERAKSSHYVELGSSSVNDLVNALDGLLKSHATLTGACQDIVVVKERLAKLESQAKAQQELSKAKPKPQPIKESDDAVA